MQTFRSKLIASFIGSIVVFLLLSVSTQSAYEAFRNADFSEQETTIVRGCNHNDLSNLFFTKNSCNFDDKIDEREDGIDLGESDDQNKSTGGTPRDRKVKDLPPFSIMNVVESTSSSNKMIFFTAVLVLVAFVGYRIFHRRRRSSLPREFESESTRWIQASSETSIRQTNLQSVLTPPEQSLRLMLFDFNQRLPLALKRRSHESLTDWTDRIHLVTPLSPYFVTRYAAQAEVEALDAQAIHHFEQDLARYLKTKLSH
ncbi:hypothetical protein [Exiguobacterium sp. Leaf196]|uniref:hypothetical protein n=1 Tax=Exiguobacterium sp. Leaf196 TaxID=1736298 RepID=UPI0006FA9FBA|nr:hypothetical protein [Exiguobacterium sp. Leaf196]KQS45428.1 hypothetical protein ASG02_05135 [Exiguobacterium sp. Leaf196]